MSFYCAACPRPDLRGEGVLAASAEYRLALFRVLPGFGTAPLWLKNLGLGTFVDGGQVFQWKRTANLIELRPGYELEDFSIKRFSLSSGIELRSDVSIAYAPPLTFRAGYGFVFYRQGEWVGLQANRSSLFSSGHQFLRPSKSTVFQ